MKRILLALLLAVCFNAGAQISMSVPNGSFEQWTTYPGYSVSVFVPVSVYDAFQAPTGWDFPTYPVNETLSMGFMSVNINTDLPLIVASQDTAAVPDSSSAVKLETFMLSDIISPTVYSLAAGTIDTMLTNMVFPSILATGAMDIEHFVPIMNSLIANMDSIEALLVSLLAEDVNYYFTGGLAMDGFMPTYLTGSYRYQSAVGGDNGGVLILGTRYDSVQGRRVLVGGGANIALTDCTEYSPFTVDYISLHDYDASYPEQAPDSLIVMLVSSASLNRQQGSYLCVDSLALWHVDPPIPDTIWRTVTVLSDNDSLGEVIGGGVYPDSSWVTIAASILDTFSPEYHVEFDGWDDGDTTNPRQVFVTSDTAFTALFRVVFDTTASDTTTQAITQLSNQAVAIYPNPASGHCVVSLPDGVKAELRLYSYDGRLLQAVAADGRQVTLPLLEPGVFLLQVVTKEGVLSRKIVNK